MKHWQWWRRAIMVVAMAAVESMLFSEFLNRQHVRGRCGGKYYSYAE
jgi:hypothetical protein